MSIDLHKRDLIKGTALAGVAVMGIDRDVSHSSSEPLVSCFRVEAGQRHAASFKEDSLQPVNGDGSRRDDDEA